MHSNDDARPSCSLNLTTGLWYCHGCEASGNGYQAAIATGATAVEADRLLAQFGLPRTWGDVEAIYDYLDQEGTLLYQVVRSAGKEFRQRRPDPGTGAWIWNLQGAQRVPYRLRELDEAVKAGQMVYVVEGEKDVEAIRAAGAVATCNSGGAGKWQPEFARFLHGASVLIVADRDRAGLRHAEQVLASLEGVAASAAIVVAREGKDAADHLAAGYGLDEFELPPPPDEDVAELSEATVERIVESGAQTERADPVGRKRAKEPSTADILVALAERSGMVFFHDPELRGYASFDRDGHETWPLKSRSFRHYLLWLYYQATRESAAAQAVQDAIATLEGRALFAGETVPVHVRLAGDDDVIYLDLADDGWQVVEVRASGWRVIEAEAPVRFRRPGGMAALPRPERGGTLEELRRFVNLASDDDWRLLVAWLLAALRPPGQPYPVLALHGEQGSAKSTSARLLRDLIDPNSSPLRAAPRETRDLMIAANAGWVLSFDNLSYLQPWLSDALCRIATGGGFATRELYTDDEERIFDAQRPVILNGIEELATRSDLLDRAILLTLPRIPKEKRREEKEFWASFSEAKPRILGALLDAVSTALANVASTRLPELPRMADFALWVTAAEPTLEWERGSFLRSYTGNREQADELAIEASPVGRLLIQIADAGFAGTATELLAALEERAGERERKSPGWPKSAQSLGGLVRRLAPNLRSLGFDVEFDRGKKTRLIVLRRPAVNTVTAVTPVIPAQACGRAGRGDDSDDAGDDLVPASHTVPHKRKADSSQRDSAGPSF